MKKILKRLGVCYHDWKYWNQADDGMLCNRKCVKCGKQQDLGTTDGESVYWHTLKQQQAERVLNH